MVGGSACSEEAGSAGGAELGEVGAEGQVAVVMLRVLCGEGGAGGRVAMTTPGSSCPPSAKVGEGGTDQSRELSRSSARSGDRGDGVSQLRDVSLSLSSSSSTNGSLRPAGAPLLTILGTTTGPGKGQTQHTGLESDRREGKRQREQKIER